MKGNLVIVESPAKAKTIEKFLGNDYQVVSSYGHVRDLSKKDFGIDIEKDFEPKYIIPDDKKKVVKELKALAKDAEAVWIATDEDREGEAIAWHLCEVLGLDMNTTKRIVFHEITENAIFEAIKKPRSINIDLVDAQQARRVLDRLVGFELSPVLWRKVKPALSAGRVQSVAVKLLVEREREIRAFVPTPSFRVISTFITNDGKTFYAELSTRLKVIKEVKDFLNSCSNAEFSITNIEKKPAKKSPSAPFTTSTLQQEASRKLGFSVARTMIVAQRLYESGKITYMRTDSVNLSNLALNSAAKVITKEFGKEYLNTRDFQTKSKGAQEAHEAIRPTYIDEPTVSGNAAEKKLYELIWKRTVASQMSDAKLEKTTITIDISNRNEDFIATGEVLKFDGFLKVYIESSDNENEESTIGLLPPLKENELLDMKEIVATEKFTYPPPRYTEASLVRKLEELGIGRPSTYAPTITTIQNRGYVVKEERPGTERNYKIIKLSTGKITEETKKEITGKEKSKLFPTDVGMIVNDFLVQHFDNIINYNFTASVEKKFDDIAGGKAKWVEMIDQFYHPFHEKIDSATKSKEKSKGERILGNDPETGKVVSVKIGRYGPIVQIGETGDEEKPRFASLLKGHHLETITLEEALTLFSLPRSLGDYENKEVTVGVGRFGPYVKHNNKFVSLKKGVDDPFTIDLPRAIELIEEKRLQERNKKIKSFDEEKELEILNGRWGPYIAYKGKNFRIPKGKEPKELTIKDCMEIINKSKKSSKK